MLKSCHTRIRELTSAQNLSHTDSTKTRVTYDDSQYNLQYNFIAKCQYTDCTRNVVVFCFLLACEKIEFIYIYLIFTHMPVESYHGQLRSLFSCQCVVYFLSLINSLVC